MPAWLDDGRWLTARVSASGAITESALIFAISDLLNGWSDQETIFFSISRLSRTGLLWSVTTRQRLGYHLFGKHSAPGVDQQSQAKHILEGAERAEGAELVTRRRRRSGGQSSRPSLDVSGTAISFARASGLRCQVLEETS